MSAYLTDGAYGTGLATRTTDGTVSDSSRKMRRATQLLKDKHPEIEADGEMQGDTALSAAARKLVLPHSKLEGEANILIMPNLDTANVAYQMIKTLADALPVGPILIGPARPAHILTPSVTRAAFSI